MSVLLDLFQWLTRHPHPRTKDEILSALADEHRAQTGESLDWRKSVVDRMKALKIDERSTTFEARKRIAAYYGIYDYEGTAEENAKLAECLTDDLVN